MYRPTISFQNILLHLSPIFLAAITAGDLHSFLGFHSSRGIFCIPVLV
jgi:hypothetical protein